jgi:hypothetical protein
MGPVEGATEAEDEAEGAAEVRPIRVLLTGCVMAVKMSISQNAIAVIAVKHPNPVVEVEGTEE